LGLGYKPNDDLTLSFEISHMDYSSMDYLTFKYENMTVEQSTYYRDTMLIAFGVEYKLNGQWGLQGGCYYTQGASRNKRWHYATNDVDLIVPSLGFYYDISEKIELNITGFYVWGIEEKHDNKTYDQDNPIVLAGVRCVL
jgi:long-subunit fatty acid transport protein